VYLLMFIIGVHIIHIFILILIVLEYLSLETCATIGTSLVQSRLEPILNALLVEEVKTLQLDYVVVADLFLADHAPVVLLEA